MSEVARAETPVGDPAEWQLAPDHVLHRVQRGGLLVGGVALALSLLGALIAPGPFFRAYLVAYLFVLAIALGSLAILMVQYLTGGAWGALARRVLESSTRTLPLLAVLFLPLVFGIRELYEWARPEVMAHDALLQEKRLYLNVPFFLARAVFYFAVWNGVAHYLNRWSLEQDRTGDPTVTRRLEMLSRGGLLLYGFTITFAAIDWGMSLEPHWFSTIYGVLFMGGQGLSAFAFTIPIIVLLAERPPYSRIIGPSHFNDLGNLMLAFVMLWAYFSFSQFLLIWAGNLTEEIPWYLRRTRDGWQWLTLVVVATHFALPFLLLLSRDVKRRRKVLAVVACGIIGARVLEIFWLVRPPFAPAFHVLDPLALVGVGGVWLWYFVGQLKTRPLVPLRDPCLPEVAA